MRDLMNIIALMEGSLSTTGFDQWRSTTDLEHGHDLIDEVVEDIGGKLKFVMMANRWRTSLPDPVPLFRGIHVDDPEAWIAGHTRDVGRDAGVSWTDDYQTAINENGPDGGFQRDQRGPTNLILCAMVPKDSIDWYASAALQMIDQDEPEIRLFRHAPVHIHEVYLLNTPDANRLEKLGREHINRVIPVSFNLKA